MNGHGDDWDYAPRPDDDYDGPEQTDIECPFCGHYTEFHAATIYCDNCEVVWHSAAEIEADRAAQDTMVAERDEPSDAAMFDRAMRGWGVGL